MDEVSLAERLIGIDTSHAAGVGAALEVIAVWCADRQIGVRALDFPGDRRALLVRACAGTPELLFAGHVDVVPGAPGQFVPRIAAGRLYGRGAYDMKGALAAMLLAVADLAAAPPAAGVSLLIVPDEERVGLGKDPAASGENCTEMAVREGLRCDLAICGEPTEMQVGVQAKGVMILRAHVSGRAAHGSTPWLGDNAILRGVELVARAGELPFMREATDLFPGPSLNLSRIHADGPINAVPDACVLEIDLRFLPGQDPDVILHQLSGLDRQVRFTELLRRPAATLDPGHPLVRTLVGAARAHDPAAAAVGRDGASDAVAFQGAGMAAVEFGPRGADHHGPAEWVDVESLAAYRRALVATAHAAAEAMRRPAVTA